MSGAALGEGMFGDPVNPTGPAGGPVPVVVVGTVSVKGAPGATIGPTAPDTVIGIGATVPLPLAPAGTRRMTVSNNGPGGTLIRVRELGAGAGTGPILPRFNSATLGGLDGAVAPVEAEEVAGIATAASVLFERD